MSISVMSVYFFLKRKITALILASLENKPYLCPQNAIKCLQALTNFKILTNLIVGYI